MVLDTPAAQRILILKQRRLVGGPLLCLHPGLLTFPRLFPLPEMSFLAPFPRLTPTHCLCPSSIVTSTGNLSLTLLHI